MTVSGSQVKSDGVRQSVNFQMSLVGSADYLTPITEPNSVVLNAPFAPSWNPDVVNLKFTGAVYRESEPEFIGRMPIRQELETTPLKKMTLSDLMPEEGMMRIYSCLDCGRTILEGREHLHSEEACVVIQVMES